MNNSTNMATCIQDTTTSKQIHTKNYFHYNSLSYQKTQEAWQDIVKGTKNWPIWSHMAITEIKRRYRRTLFGPFWTTLSVALYIGSMGILFSFLWKMDIKKFLPYFASGYICWTLFSTIVTESCHTFIASEHILKQIPLPYCTFSWLVVCRNILIFAHHAIFYVLIIIITRTSLNANILFFIPGIFIVTMAGFSISLIIGTVCARYRDLFQVIGILLQISMFVTPIFWFKNQMSGIRSIVFINLNPLYHYINIIREPLLGNSPQLINWVASIAITLVLTIIAFLTLANYQRKLIFWL